MSTRWQILALSQTAYIETLLKCFNMQDTSPVSTPLEPGLALSKTQCPRAHDTTRHFLTCPFHVESQTHSLGSYGIESSALVRYTDADWGSQDDCHSIFRYAFIVDGGAIAWSSKKQPHVALSTRNLLGEIFRPLDFPTILYCDNQSTITFVNRGGYSARNKHLDIRYTWVKELVDDGDATLDYCNTDDMTADIFTKALARPKIEKFSTSLGLHGKLIPRRLASHLHPQFQDDG